MKRVITGLLLIAMSGSIVGCASGRRPIGHVAFGSCARQDEPMPIWDTIADQRPDVFLFIGDNIYADTEDIAVMRAKYDVLNRHPGYARLKRTCPVLATWDDHDYGVNDGGAEYAMRDASQRAFLEAFDEPADSPRWDRPGVYMAEIFGPPGQRVQIILLDTRYFRGPLTRLEEYDHNRGPYVPNTDSSVTMLGDSQWGWLAEQLRKPAEVRIVVSSIQVIAEDHGWEKWDNLPHERERLFDLIRATGAHGVIFVSGDRHLAELSMMNAGAGYPLYDLTSSALNSSSPDWRPYETNGLRVGTMNWGNNFGQILIDWQRDDPLIRLQILDEAGEVTIQRKIPLSTLRPQAR